MSHITLPAWKVIELATEYMERKKARIREIQEETIQKEMQPKCFGLVKAKTREQAIAHLNLNASEFSDYKLALLSGEYYTRQINDLRKAALLTARSALDNPVVVDSDIAAMLYKDENGRS